MVAQEFLPGVEDAWRVALLAAASDIAFTDEAGALGAAVADVHLALGELFAREQPSAELIDAAPQNAALRTQRSALLREVGLPDTNIE